MKKKQAEDEPTSLFTVGCRVDFFFLLVFLFSPIISNADHFGTEKKQLPSFIRTFLLKQNIADRQNSFLFLGKCNM